MKNKQEIKHLTFYSIVPWKYSTTAGIQGPAWREQARRGTPARYAALSREVHKSATTCSGRTHLTTCARRRSWLMWLDVWTHVCIFESSQREGLYLGYLLRSRSAWSSNIACPFPSCAGARCFWGHLVYPAVKCSWAIFGCVCGSVFTVIPHLGPFFHFSPQCFFCRN